MEGGKSGDEAGARAHLGSAPASRSISITPWRAAGDSILTARWRGVASSKRFWRSTSVPETTGGGQWSSALCWVECLGAELWGIELPSWSRRSSSAVGEGDDALKAPRPRLSVSANSSRLYARFGCFRLRVMQSCSEPSSRGQAQLRPHCNIKLVFFCLCLPVLPRPSWWFTSNSVSGRASTSSSISPESVLAAYSNRSSGPGPHQSQLITHPRPSHQPHHSLIIRSSQAYSVMTFMKLCLGATNQGSVVTEVRVGARIVNWVARFC